ncbi:hypothetical protein CLOP_g1697 [Closterium sp. NIES-67]|nr:hypothetical protein CLOP_g1697 [Closterium sp. NIES-67]
MQMTEAGEARGRGRGGGRRRGTGRSDDGDDGVGRSADASSREEMRRLLRTTMAGCTDRATRSHRRETSA